jgi:hypothetical protein
VLYQAVLRDGNAMVASDFHRLAVIPDAPPTLTVVRPEPRTEIAFGAPLAVPLEARGRRLWCRRRADRGHRHDGLR